MGRCPVDGFEFPRVHLSTLESRGVRRAARYKNIAADIRRVLEKALLKVGEKREREVLLAVPYRVRNERCLSCRAASSHT